MGWSALVALPDLGTRVLSASAVVAYVAVGAAAILGGALTDAARDALAWVLPRDVAVDAPAACRVHDAADPTDEERRGPQQHSRQRRDQAPENQRRRRDSP